MRAEIERAGRRDPLRAAGSPTCVIEDGRRRAPLRGLVLAGRRDASRPTTSCWRVGHSARDTFADAARPRRPHRGQAVLDRLPHRASAVADRPRPLRRRTPATRCSAPPTTSWCTTAANGRSVYSFCMCPGGTVVAATSRAGPRRHQRHEPVLAQRAQRQRRHRRRHHAGATTPATPLAGIEFQRHWEARAFEAGGGNYARARRSASAISSPAAPSTALGEVVPSLQAGRDAGRPRRAACPTTRSRRSARRCPPSTGRSAASPWPTRC